MFLVCLGKIIHHRYHNGAVANLFVDLDLIIYYDILKFE